MGADLHGSADAAVRAGTRRERDRWRQAVGSAAGGRVPLVAVRLPHAQHPAPRLSFHDPAPGGPAAAAAARGRAGPRPADAIDRLWVVDGILIPVRDWKTGGPPRRPVLCSVRGTCQDCLSRTPALAQVSDLWKSHQMQGSRPSPRNGCSPTPLARCGTCFRARRREACRGDQYGMSGASRCPREPGRVWKRFCGVG